MPPVRIYDTLPTDVRRRFRAEAQARGWGDLRGLSAWLAAEGYTMGRTAVTSAVSALKREHQDTLAAAHATAELASILADQPPDERLALSVAAARVAHESLLRVTLAMRQAEDDPAAVARLMPHITRALSDLAQIDVAREKWAAERARATVDQVASRVAGEGGTATPERLREIAREIYGV